MSDNNTKSTKAFQDLGRASIERDNAKAMLKPHTRLQCARVLACFDAGTRDHIAEDGSLYGEHRRRVWEIAKEANTCTELGVETPCAACAARAVRWAEFAEAKRIHRNAKRRAQRHLPRQEPDARVVATPDDYRAACPLRLVESP